YDDNDLDSTKLTPAFGATFSTAGNKGETKSFSHADLLSFLTDDNNDLVTLVLIRKYDDSPDTDQDKFATKEITPSGGSLGDWAPHLVLMTDNIDPLPELSETTVYENDPPGTSVGTLSIDNAVDGKTYTFSLPAGVFSNDFFEITVGATTNIRTKVFLDDGVMSPLRIVATEFSGGATYTNDLYTIVASAVNTPTFIASASVAPTAQNNDVVATLKSRASNGSVTYTVPAGRNDIFKISGAELQVKDNTLLGAVSTTNYVALVATDDNDGSADKLIVEVVTENAASAGAVFMFR
ncbi:MAG: hypothetical protein ISS35_07895, partial [Kiritimatiellae bacterium]|nr:hypothetical protein [Kiritimatiellia bacterium]